MDDDNITTLRQLRIDPSKQHKWSVSQYTAAVNSKNVYGSYSGNPTPPNAVVYATLPLTLSGLGEVMMKARAFEWKGPAERYEANERQKRKALATRASIALTGRPAKDGVTEPLLKAYKNTLRKWYTKMRKDQTEDQGLVKLQIMLIETTNTFCSTYRNQVNAGDTPVADLDEHAKDRLAGILKTDDVHGKEYIHRLRRALRAWWKTKGHTNNIMTKKLYEVPVSTILGKKTAKGVLTIMLPKEGGAAALAMFAGVQQQDLDMLLGHGSTTPLGFRANVAYHSPPMANNIVLDNNGQQSFSKYAILSLSEARTWTARSNIIDIFCSFVASADQLDAAVSSKKKREQLVKALVTTETCKSLGSGNDSTLAAEAQRLAQRIKEYVNAKLIPKDEPVDKKGCVVLGVDTRKGCEVHYYRPNDNGKLTLSFNPNADEKKRKKQPDSQLLVQVRGALGITEAKSIIDGTALAMIELTPP